MAARNPRATLRLGPRRCVGDNLNPCDEATQFGWVPCQDEKADFIEPMDCAPVSRLPDGPRWIYEIKLDGYRAVAITTDGGVSLFSRRHKSFNHQYPHIVEALAELPESTVVDGEIVALDESGHPKSASATSSRLQPMTCLRLCANRGLKVSSGSARKACTSLESAQARGSNTE